MRRLTAKRMSDPRNTLKPFSESIVPLFVGFDYNAFAFPFHRHRRLQAPCTVNSQNACIVMMLNLWYVTLNPSYALEKMGVLGCSFPISLRLHQTFRLVFQDRLLAHLSSSKYVPVLLHRLSSRYSVNRLRYHLPSDVRFVASPQWLLHTPHRQAYHR